MAGYNNFLNNFILDRAAFGTTNFSSISQVSISPLISTGAVTSGMNVNPIFTSSSGDLYGEQILPAFNPSDGNHCQDIYGLSIVPTITPTGTGTISTAYGISISSSVSSNTVTNAYSLYVTNASGAGSILNNYTAVLGTNSNALVGIGFLEPSFTFHVSGATSATRIIGITSGTTANKEIINIAEGTNQGTLSSGCVGTNKTMSANTTVCFDLTSVDARCTGMSGGVFDGRYIYFVPFMDTSIITRYDTTLPFDSVSSYTTISNIGSDEAFSGGVFDGQYVYFVVAQGLSPSTLSFVRYNTKRIFQSSSLEIFNAYALALSVFGYAGAVFDGRYIYFVPVELNPPILRYDTTLSFTVSSSYTTFALSDLSAEGEYRGGVYDGRYVYFTQLVEGGTAFSNGTVICYDTTLSFTSTNSYTAFNPGPSGHASGVFDGRYIYFLPNASTASATVARYDTTLQCNDINSYTGFCLNQIYPFSRRFLGGVFDGRYIYFVPDTNTFGSADGVVVRFDTTLPFNISSSYTTLNTASINGNSVGFQGGVYDGRYVYLIPYAHGVVTRINAYSGPKATAMAANQAPNGFKVGYYGTEYDFRSIDINNIEIAGSVGIGLVNPSYLLHLNADSAGKPVSNSWMVLSDVRIKRNIQDIPDALTKISQLQPRKFQYHSAYANDIGTDPDQFVYGFVADEVEGIVEGCVRPSGMNCYNGKLKEWSKHNFQGPMPTPVSGLTNLKSLNINNIVIYYIQAIKDLADVQDQLQKEIDDLK